MGRALKSRLRACVQFYGFRNFDPYYSTYLAPFKAPVEPVDAFLLLNLPKHSFKGLNRAIL